MISSNRACAPPATPGSSQETDRLKRNASIAGAERQRNRKQHLDAECNEVGVTEGKARYVLQDGEARGWRVGELYIAL